jgi:Fe-S-cluster containining protein
MLVPVNGFDVARIAYACGLGVETIVDVIDDDTGHAGVFHIGKRRCSLVLAKNPSDPRACTFLSTADRGIRRCGIHANRPRVCAIFPMALLEGAIVVRETPACAKSNWNQSALSHTLWSGYIAQDARDAIAYGHIVSGWNASARAEIDDGGRAFLAFIIEACSALLDA